MAEKMKTLTIGGVTFEVVDETARKAGVKSIARTSGNGSAGTTDTYTITLMDGSTMSFNVYNGKNGKDGSGADGKSAYAYAKDGGFTGTEAEFAKKMAASGTESDKVFIADYDTTTFAAVKAAHDAGKLCFVKSDGMPFCQLLGLTNSEAVFVREINDTTDYVVTFTSNGGKSFTLQDKNNPLYVAQSFSDAQKAQARANIGAAAVSHNHKAAEVTFADGQTFQNKYDNGNLTGPRGSTGATGATGIGIASVTQTTTSNADGGSNVITVTLTNGTKSTFTVKNGSKGSTGANGLAGNAALVVMLSGDDASGYKIDKTFAEIQSAWNAGREVYLYDGASVFKINFFMEDFMVLFTSVILMNNTIQVQTAQILASDSSVFSFEKRTI